VPDLPSCEPDGAVGWQPADNKDRITKLAIALGLQRRFLPDKAVDATVVDWAVQRKHFMVVSQDYR